MSRVLRALLTGALLAPAPLAAQADPLAGFAEYVEQARRDWGVPGLAVAVVRGDSVAFARGFGVRRLGEPAPVDVHTMFANASTTKAFTTTALAMLVDAGKLRWDDPVTRHLPGFQLFDPHVTREITVRDLVTHRSGLAAGDLLWYASDTSPAEISRRLRFQRPASSLRSQYAYNNNLYAVAGQVIESASGMPWADFIRRRILDPLGMSATLPDLQGLSSRDNVAAPHLEIDGTVRPIEYRNLDNIAPAGAMNSNVAEMTRWIRFQLDSARVDGRRLVSDSMFAATLTPQTLIPAASYYPAARLARPSFTAYGLGWFLQDYRGRKLAMHTGSIDGMSALVALVPEERLGFVVFANLDHAELRHALMYRVLDAHLGGPTRDWSRELRTLYGSMEAQARAARAKREAGRIRGTRPSRPLAAYTGVYADSLHGEASVSAESGRLVLRKGAARAADLEHWHLDTWRVQWRDPRLGRDFATFVLAPDGRVAALRLEGFGEMGKR